MSMLKSESQRSFIWPKCTRQYLCPTPVQVSEHFSTALGLPISTADNPSVGGAVGFFISNPQYPGTIYLVTARDVVFHPDMDNNMLYKHRNPSQPCKKVLLFSDPVIEKHIEAIKSQEELEVAEQMGEEEGEAEQLEVLPQLVKAKTANGDLKIFLSDVSRDWKEQRNHVLLVVKSTGHYNV
ncbi:hypothetical protein EDD15DRAFT_2373166 [Pisolithus albus]|nr:hypothetical protein EDD15DRAFT_2373166 [Pisolithus albus]